MNNDFGKNTIVKQGRLDDYLVEASADELSILIARLEKAQKEAAAREKKEKEEEELRQAEEKREAHIQEVTSMELPMDWENVFANDEKVQGVHADNPSDGMILSLNNLGRVDIEYIAAITGEDCKSVICSLKGAIYQNPDTWNECFYKGWETSDQYLSGNLKYKWDRAEKANEKYEGYFEDNLTALKEELSPSISYQDIYITLGSPWVPADVIDDFITAVFGLCGWMKKADIAVRYDDMTGTWEVPNKRRYGDSVFVTQRYGTKRMGALHILEKTLNMQTPSVYDIVQDPMNPDKKKRVINEAETVAAVEKQKELVKAFQDWVWTDELRKRRLTKIYGDRFYSIRKRKYDGSWLQFPDMSKDVELHPYQKDAAARIILSPNTLLAHEVGAGKTYEMVAAGMKMKQTGLSGKNLYVVPNNLIGQWETIFLDIYPQANLLTVEPKNFMPKKRQNMLEKIRDNEYDGIIMAYSCFGEIPLSRDFYVEKLKQELNQIREQKTDGRKTTNALRKREESVIKELDKLFAATVFDCDDDVHFDDLGITRLFVDEAHNYKNVPIDTKIKNVMGINATGSAKCADMMDKVYCVQKQNNGGGVVMATGTPITNSITDIFVMQKYLQRGELERLGLGNFDSWVGMFAEKTTEFEIDVDTSNYRMATRFKRFHNLSELTNLLSYIADFHSMHESGLPLCEYHEEVVGKTSEFEEYLQEISERADLVRNYLVSRSEDNMLKITTDGRKAALDMRLVDSSVPATSQNKATRCAENIAEIYWKYDRERLTQLVFCDTSVPKSDFNMYDEMKRLLVMEGIPECEIAYVHDANTEKKRSVLFQKVRDGEIRVLIGSTFKIGLGVNVQDRLIAVHHLDVPWRPADMVQREGRILRPGNGNSKVHIYRYITEDSFDAYSWQLLETKQHTIAELLSSSMGQRSCGDVQDSALNYAEVKALAVGDPLIRDRVEAENELNRYLSLQRKQKESREDMKEELLALPVQIGDCRKQMDLCMQDMDFCDEEREKEEVEPEDRKKRKAYRERLRKRLHQSVNDNVLSLRERSLLTYRGFEVILPANMRKEKKYVWLKRSGKYYVELGDTEKGDLIRLDNKLDHLGTVYDDFQKKLNRLLERQASLKKEIEDQNDYSEEIMKYQNKLRELDRELGVENYG